MISSMVVQTTCKLFSSLPPPPPSSSSSHSSSITAGKPLPLKENGVSCLLFSWGEKKSKCSAKVPKKTKGAKQLCVLYVLVNKNLLTKSTAVSNYFIFLDLRTIQLLNVKEQQQRLLAACLLSGKELAVNCRWGNAKTSSL